MKKTPAAPDKRPHPQRFPIVGVGASAGGLEAFTRLLNRLPTDTGIGFVLVQHLDPTHESELTRLLARATSMPTREVTNNLRVEPNHVYIIPPNVDLSITRGVLKLQPRPEGRRPHHAIDFFFESLAQDQSAHAIGVVLSGTATDGTLGLEAIKAEGGITFAQDESAKYASMPRSAVAAGCVDFVLPPEGIANELARIAKHPYVVNSLAGGDIAAVEAPSPAAGDAAVESVDRERDEVAAHEDDTSALPSGGHGTPDDGAERARAEAQRGRAPADEQGLKNVLLLLRNHSGVDFSLYKSSTIGRRIARRMILNQHTAFADYAKFLRGNAKELDTLFSDVLISVTSFFRNPEAFDVLKRVVFPRLLRPRRADTLRVWVLGCSTGQEAYSIGMAYSEFAEDVAHAPKLQIFATDLNDALLDKARAGLYAQTLAADLSPERLRRFFVEEEGGYRVIKPLRQMVVFARQNLISDPPFSRLDLISCRNLLIYLEPAIQKKALPTFHYALKPDGFLLLGSSESVGQFTDLFESVDRKQKLFSRKSVATPPHHMPATRRTPTVTEKRAIQSLPASPDSVHAELTAQREADRVAVREFAPPGVLVNAELQILQFRGPTSAYLTPPSGAASFDVLKMAREGLMLPLRTAINKAKKEQKTVRVQNAHVGQNGATRAVNLQVIPLKNLKERCYLILFEDVGKRGDGSGDDRPRGRATKATAEIAAAPDDERGGARTLRQRLNASERELAETRDYLQSLQEQHDAAHEELQASNEEFESTNEELQSVNEELETSKEELESSNEELTTINDETSQRNAELNRLNADLNNLHVSIDTGILVLGRDLTIRRFTPPAAKLFNLLATDVGRSLGGIRDNLSVPALPDSEGGIESSDARSTVSAASRARPLDLEKLVLEVIATARLRECEVQDNQGRWYSLRVRPT